MLPQKRPVPYLGSIVKERDIEEVRYKITVGWLKWKSASGVYAIVKILLG